MSEVMIQLSHVTKKYHGRPAVKDCSLHLEKGRIYGLAGKNGAGKTTMMRMIAGLSIPDEGKIVKNTEKIGMLIEAPSLNGSMTAAENLKFCRLLSGCPGTAQTDEELLALVGLTGTGRKKVKDFSLGMRQRLGIATAILGNPGFVMLDEPVNGLDPIGVVEIRNLIRRLCGEFGMTVLVSSHNLPELYQTATDYIIIDRGTVKREITHEALEQESGGDLEAFFLSTINGKNTEEGGGQYA